MAKPRNLSQQFNVIHERLGKGSHALTLTDFDSDNLARVSFENYTDINSFNGSTKPTIEIDYLKSNREGRGHAKTLMQHMYDRYPKSFIDWGLTIHPAATHLAEHFENKYYNRTAYEPNDGEE